MKNTKKALLASALSIVLCISMLLGTTFAWFTDSVTSGKNTITSGNLDIELEYYDGSDWQPVTDNTSLFDNEALWEPGYTEVAYLRLSNKGTLALKYNLAINIYNEVTGTNVAGNSFKLSDYIKMGVDEAWNGTPYADRSAAIAAIGDAGKIAAYTKVGNMAKDATASTFAVVVYMPDTVGNEANYKPGTTAPSIEMGIELVATQDTVESDSFDNKYDDAAWVALNADAIVTDATALKDALKEGGLVALGSDITGDLNLTDVADDTILNFAGNTVNGTVTLGENQKITINGKGGVKASGKNPAVKLGKGTDVTLAGGTFTSEEGVAVSVANAKTETPMKITIEEGTTITAPTLISLDAMKGYAGAEVEINGGDFKATATGSYISPINVGGGNVTINDGTFEVPNGTNYVYFVDVSEKYDTETGGYTGGNVTINGGTFKSDADYAYVVYASVGTYANRKVGTVTINGGDFEFTGNYGYLTGVGEHVVVNDCNFKTGGSKVFDIGRNNTTDRTIEVNGGNFTVTTYMSTWSIPLGGFAESYPTDTSPVGKVILKGGTINSYICDGTTIGGRTSVDLVADGYHVVDNGDGTKSVVAD